MQVLMVREHGRGTGSEDGDARGKVGDEGGGDEHLEIDRLDVAVVIIAVCQWPKEKEIDVVVKVSRRKGR